MCSAVGLEVGALGVHLVAAAKVTAVETPLLQRLGGVGGQGVLGPRLDDHRRVVTPKERQRGGRGSEGAGVGGMSRGSPSGLICTVYLQTFMPGLMLGFFVVFFALCSVLVMLIIVIFFPCY